MLGREVWGEIHQLFEVEKWTKSAIARELGLDVKTVRRCLRQREWTPYRRQAAPDTLLSAHAEFLDRRAPEVGYSARILFQELVGARGYTGSYETVKRFVRPLRQELRVAERATVRFETPPGLQSQIDWGQARILFRSGWQVRHIFVLTLGFSRRAFYLGCRNEMLATFLDAHERAFEYFGGRTKEHLYDRPRTICRPRGDGSVEWNPTFRSFAHYWGFEPRLCRPYRARTKGKVEAGVRYFKINFLPGRSFYDDLHFDEQLAEWTATIADLRLHGTTHERPIDRFQREKASLVVTASQPPFRLEMSLLRVVANDYLVTLDTNRYSVPFRLLGRSVEVKRREGRVLILCQGELVAEHEELPGRHQVRVLPEHGPGAIARNGRRPRSGPAQGDRGRWADLPVEVRDLAIYDTLSRNPGGLS
ncbi:MAG: IS21 family transposase [Anaerolineales bacterium]